MKLLNGLPQLDTREATQVPHHAVFNNPTAPNLIIPACLRRQNNNLPLPPLLHSCPTIILTHLLGPWPHDYILKYRIHSQPSLQFFCIFQGHNLTLMPFILHLVSFHEFSFFLTQFLLLFFSGRKAKQIKTKTWEEVTEGMISGGGVAPHASCFGL